VERARRCRLVEPTDEIFWVIAEDNSKAEEFLCLKPAQKNNKQRKWLQRHNQNTAGIPGIFPLYHGLRVRLSENINERLGLLKHCNGIVTGWALHADDQASNHTGARVLQYLPTCIYIQFPHATWRFHDNLGIGVYPINPIKYKWVFNKKTEAFCIRRGFPLVPDITCTDYMEQDMTLQAATMDCGGVLDPTALKNMLATYITQYPIKAAETLLIIQTFFSRLVQQGPPPGPEILMRLLRGEIEPEAAATEYRQTIKKQREERKATSTQELTWRCSTCPPKKAEKTTAHFWKLNKKYKHPSYVFNRIIAPGHWRKCKKCSKTMQKTHDNERRINDATCRICHQEMPLNTLLEKKEINLKLATGKSLQLCTKCATDVERIRQTQLHTLLTCTACPTDRKNKPRDQFSTRMLKHCMSNTRKCNDCERRCKSKTLRCTGCGASRTKNEFNPEMWKYKNKKRRCKSCAEEPPPFRHVPLVPLKPEPEPPAAAATQP